MRIRSRGAGMAAALAAALALAPGARAQRPTVQCGEGQFPVLDLGIANLAAPNMYRTRSAGRPPVWGFTSEPWVAAVRPGGPADGKLEPEDRIVSIDGMLITTAAGGRRWSGVGAGRTVTLVIRRGGRERTYAIEVGWRCFPSRAEAEELRFAARSVERSMRFMRTEANRQAMFGFAIRCGESCALVNDSTGAPRLGEFFWPPLVAEVEEGSPAARGGLRVGDAIESVDGLPVTSEEGARRFWHAQPGRLVRFTVRRGGARVTVDVVPEPPRTGARP